MMNPDWNFNFPHPGGEPFDDDEDTNGTIFAIVATNQNTITIPCPDDTTSSQRLRIRRPRTHGGPDVWHWHLVNTGGGDIWARWDGHHTAFPEDPHSAKVPSGSSIRANAKIMTVAGAGEISLLLDNMSGVGASPGFSITAEPPEIDE